ncbi:MAG: PD-(D/E)XK nuclease family protein [Prochlorothrix sp.]|nr:PD-(D/E)XK nuclease family protein [Prochlorothrix sp.]
MARFIRVNSYPDLQGLPRLDKRYTVITVSQLAARTLGTSHQSLNRLASRQMEHQGWTIASLLQAQALFRQVLQTTLQAPDRSGQAKTWFPTVRSLLQGSPTLPTLASADPRLSTRTHQLLEVAAAFQRALHQRKLVDLSELYWRAAESSPKAQKVLIYGYFQPRSDELAWINAIAAPDSILVLPSPQAPLFQDIQRLIEQLVDQGWTIETGANGTETSGTRTIGMEVNGTETSGTRTIETGANGTETSGTRTIGLEAHGIGANRTGAIETETSGTRTIGATLSQVFIDSDHRDRDHRDRGHRDTRHRGDTSSSATSPADTAPLTPVRTYRYSTLEAEIRGTLAQVKALLNTGTPARDITILTRDEGVYGPKLIDIAWEYGVPLRALYDTPLLSTRLGAWLMLLLEVIEAKWPFEATAKLLGHPLCSNPDQGFWATVRVQHPVGFAAWSAIAQAHLALDLSAFASIERNRKPDSWVNWWYERFRSFDLRKRCARWPREGVAFNTLYLSFVELAKLDDRPKSWAEFRQDLLDLLQTVTVPAQPGRGGVELHRPTSVVGARYPHLYVLGMAEGVLPAPIRNDPVLDFFERQHLQTHGVVLPTAAEQARREALLFYALLQTATGTLTLSYAALQDRQEQLPSPYLQQLGLEPEAPPTIAIASPEELRQISLRHLDDRSASRSPVLSDIAPVVANPTPTSAAGPATHAEAPQDTVLAQAYHAFTVEEQRASAQAPGEYDGIVGIPLDYSDWVFSASQLRNLGQCPFKWFADRLLNLGPPEEVDENLSPSQIGQLYHRVLELVLEAKQQNPALDITDAQLVAEKFAIAEADPRIFPTPLPSWSLRRSEHLRHLKLALADPDFLPEGAEPLQLEAEFCGEWQGLKVRGQVDRIDRTADGLVLIDYKTGKSRPAGIQDRHGKASIDVQLPLYQEAAAPALCPGEPVAKAYYYSIRGKKQMAPSSKAPQHELPEALDRCKAHLDHGHYPVQPDNQRSACTYCDFDALCRQSEAQVGRHRQHLNLNPSLNLNPEETRHGTD